MCMWQTRVHARLLWFLPRRALVHWKPVGGSLSPSGKKKSTVVMLNLVCVCLFVCVFCGHDFSIQNAKHPHLSSYSEQSVAMAMHPWPGSRSDPH